MASIKRIGKDSLGIPVWEAVYRRKPGGNQVRKRFHLPTRAMVEREIMLDSHKSGTRITWMEGSKKYLDAKRLEGVGFRSLENVERAVTVFTKIMGDLVIEDTDEDIFKDFMQAVATKPMLNSATKKKTISGPKVANEHRKDLLTIARYLIKHTNAVSVIPFAGVPPLPAREERREPIPQHKVGEYLDALPPHVRRPVLMVLYYGLRSSAVCNLTIASIDGPELIAIDKGDVHRRIIIDDTLSGIIDEAIAHRDNLAKKGAAVADSLFVNARGRSWDRHSLLHTAQKAWVAAGLEAKKIHEVRHTLGTMAGKYFTKGMVQAAMGHRSERSSAQYFHPTEEMAAEVRRKIITELSREQAKGSDNGTKQAMIIHAETGEYSCPHCHCNFIIPK